MQGTYLVHHGIKGQKWGVRRFQQDNGSLTSAGKERYSAKSDKTGVPKNNDSGSALEKFGKTYDRLHELNEKRRKTAKEHSIERGKVLSTDKHVIAKERGKLVARNVAAIIVGTGMATLSPSAQTSRLVAAGTLAVAGLSIIDYHTKMKDIKNYKASL